MVSQKNKFLLSLFLGCIITVFFTPSFSYSANSVENCRLFFKKLFVSEPQPTIRIPESSKIYSQDVKALVSQGELQRAIWTNKDKILVAKVEDYLKNAKIISEEPIAQGVTGAKKLTLAGLIDGKPVQVYAVKKTMGYENEVAFYALEKKFSLHLSPVTVEREIKNEKTSLQLFVDQAVSAADLRRFKKGDHGSMALDMMDYLTANYDRPGNYLITLDQHRVVSIDAGFAFSSARPASMKPYALAGTLDDAAKSFYQNYSHFFHDFLKRNILVQISHVFSPFFVSKIFWSNSLMLF